MSLCQVMRQDFIYGTGRYDERGTELYTNEDLKFGLAFARAYIDEGDTTDAFGMPLAAFAAWCEAKLDG